MAKKTVVAGKRPLLTMAVATPLQVELKKLLGKGFAVEIVLLDTRTGPEPYIRICTTDTNRCVLSVFRGHDAGPLVSQARGRAGK